MASYIADTIDFARMVSIGGIQGFICRATIGLREDESYAQWIPQIRAAGSIHGAYHFLYPGVPPVAQAQKFVQVRTPGWLGDWLDVENSTLGNVTWPMVRDFVAEYERLTGMNIGIYTNVGTWEGTVKWYVQEFAELHPLWVANWGVDEPAIPRPWTDWTGWQTGAKSVPGYTHVQYQNSMMVDVNRWRVGIKKAG